MLRYQKWQNLSPRGRLLKILRSLRTAQLRQATETGQFGRSGQAAWTNAEVQNIPASIGQELPQYLSYLLQDAEAASGYRISKELLEAIQVVLKIINTVSGLDSNAPTQALAQAYAESGLTQALSLLRLRLSEELGLGLADWDFGLDQDVERRMSGEEDTEQHVLVARNEADDRLRQAKRLVYLDGLRSPFNLGSILRTANFFGLDAVVLSEDALDPQHPRALRSSMGAAGRLGLYRLPFETLCTVMGELPLFAVELGGTEHVRFSYPTRAIMVLGNEEYGVRPQLLELCRASAGLVTISGRGEKASLNVGVAFGIACAGWLAGS